MNNTQVSIIGQKTVYNLMLLISLQFMDGRKKVKWRAYLARYIRHKISEKKQKKYADSVYAL